MSSDRARRIWPPHKPKMLGSASLYPIGRCLDCPVHETCGDSTQGVSRRSDPSEPHKPTLIQEPHPPHFHNRHEAKDRISSQVFAAGPRLHAHDDHENCYTLQVLRYYKMAATDHLDQAAWRLRVRKLTHLKNDVANRS